LFTISSSGSSRSVSSLRFSFTVSLGVGAVAAIGFWLLSSVALNLLNPAYSGLVGSDLRFLGASVPLLAVKVHFMTVQRLDDRVRPAALALGVFGAIEILFAILGAEFGGLLGATTGWLIAMGVEAACLWPTIRRRLRGDGGTVSNSEVDPRKAWPRLDDLTERSTGVLAVEGAEPRNSASAEHGPAAVCPTTTVQFGDSNSEGLAMNDDNMSALNDAMKQQPQSAEVYPGPGFRVALDFPRPNMNVVEMFSEFSTADISDQLKQI
jgi:hypothetical protein